MKRLACGSLFLCLLLAAFLAPEEIRAEDATAADGQLHGVVRGDDGAPLAGVHVRAWKQHSAAGATQHEYVQRQFESAPVERLGGSATTDAQGHWTIGGLAAGSFYDVQYSGPSGEVAPGQWGGAARGRAQSLRARMQPSRALRGRLLDATGQGVEGFISVTAGIATARWGSERAILHGIARHVPTGADGRFEIRVPPGARVRVHARVPGLGHRASHAIDVPAKAPKGGDPEVVIRMREAGGSTVEGTVRDDAGRAVVGALVEVAGRADRPWDLPIYMRGLTVTDEAGHYRVDGLAGAMLGHIVVSAPGHVYTGLPKPASTYRIGTPLVPGQPLLADVTLPRARTIRGRVFDEAGKPVPGAWVSWTRGSERLGPIHPKHARTDAKGRFELWGAPQGEVRLHTGAEGYFQPHAAQDGRAGVAVPAGPAGDVRRVRLTLARGGTLSGTLRDAAGEGVAGARIHLYTRFASGPHQGELTSLTTFSQSGGHFVFDGLLRGGRHELEVHAQGFVTARTNVASDPAAAALPLAVVLVRAASVSGTVVDAASAPVPGVPVWCGDQNRRVVTDARGRFELHEVAPGSQSLACGPHGAAVVERVLDLAPGTSREGEVLRLTGDKVVAGIVVDEQDRPVANEWVTVSAFHPARGEKSVRTDAQGRFEVTHVPAGKYSVQPGSPQRHPPVFEAGKEDVRIVVPVREGTFVEGVVVDTAGTHVPHGDVQLALPGEGPSSVRGGVALYGGRFRIAVPAGLKRIVLRVKQPTDGLGRPLDLMETEVEDVRVDGSRVTITLPPALNITGLIVDDQGRPVADVFVTATAEGAQLGYGRLPEVRASTDAQGRFRLIGLKDLTYTIGTRAKDAYAPAKPVEAQPGGEDVRLHVERYRSFAGRILDADGKPVVGASFWAQHHSRQEGIAVPRAYRDGRNMYFACKSDDDGRFALTRMPPDYVYTIRVALPAALSKAHFPVLFERYDPTPEPVEIKLKRGVTIAGLVTSPDGKPVKNVAVSTYGPVGADGSSDPALRRQAHTSDDGRFEVGPLPAGVKVSVSFNIWENRRQQGMPWLAQVRENVASGTHDLDITLSKGVTVSGRVEAATPEELRGISLSLVAGRTQRSFRFDGKTTSFRFVGLEPGPYELRVNPGGRREVELPYKTDVMAPAADVVIVRRLRFKLLGRLSGVKGAGFFYAEFRDDERRRRMRPVRVKRDGTFDLGKHYNSPGWLVITHTARKHVVCMRLTPDGSFVKAKAVQAQTIRGRILGLPHKITRGRVTARRGPVRFTGTIAEDGWFEIRGLPPGDWALTFSASHPSDGTFEVENPVKAGAQKVRVHWR